MRQATNSVENLALWLYNSIISFRLIFGLVVAVGLTYCSTRYNISFAIMMANSEAARELLPTSYGLLNISGAFLSIMLAVGIKNDFLRCSSIGLVGLVICMSIITGLSFQLANDSILGHEKNERRITRQEKIFNSTQSLANKSSSSYEKTEQRKTDFRDHLRADISLLQEQADRISNLENDSSPPTLVVFSTGERLTGISAATLMVIVRTIMSIAVEIAPLLCIAVLGLEIKNMYKAKKIDIDLDQETIASNDGPATGLSNPGGGQDNVVQLRAKQSAVDTVKKSILQGQTRKISKAILKN
jgi:hypothetical protein